MPAETPKVDLAILELPTEERSLTAENFTQCAEGIIDTLKYASAHRLSMRETYHELQDIYIAEEPDRRLAQFAAVLLEAPTACAHQRKLTIVKDKIDMLGSTPELSLSKETYKASIIAYNHTLREVIAENPDTFTEPQLTEWISLSSSGEGEWVESLVQGIGAEVAVARTLQASEEVHAVRYATAQEEPRGIDLVVTMQDGAIHCVDVKTGKQGLADGVTENRRGRLEVGLARGDVKDFRIRPNLRADLRQEFTRAAKWGAPLS